MEGVSDKSGICILKPNKYTYSETFIENQVRNIRHDELLFGGWRPYLRLNGKSIFTGIMKLELFRVLLKNVFPKLYNKTYSKHLASFFTSNNIKYILANYGVLGANVVDSCIAANARLIVHFHGFDASHYKTISKFRDKYTNLFEKCHKIIVVSEKMRNDLLHLGADSQKIINIPYGVDTSLFIGADPLNAEKKLIFVGRFTEKKAPDYLIMAFQKVLEKHPDAKLIMIGDGHLLEKCIKLAKSLDIVNKISFPGKKVHKEVIQELKESRIYIQHSMTAPNGDSEGTPNTILEASSMGLPIVSTRHAGIIDAVIENKTGFLVNEGDWEKMADKICNLLDDPLLCKKFGEAGRKHIETNYAIKTQCQLLEKTLLE